MVLKHLRSPQVIASALPHALRRLHDSTVSEHKSNDECGSELGMKLLARFLEAQLCIRSFDVQTV
jgi:hypothetical protein